MDALDPRMLIVTATAGEEAGGCLVGFATQASISPPLFAVMLSNKNRTYRIARDAEHLGVHLLGADRGDLAELFGGETGDEARKLGRVDWKPGPGGVPLLEACPDRFAGAIREQQPIGDHVLFVVEPVHAECSGELSPFPLHRAKGIDPGHEA